MSLTNKLAIQRAREFVGLGASVEEIADALGVSTQSVRRRLTAKERHDWATAVRVERRTRLVVATRKIRAAYYRLKRRPTAREAAVHSSVQTEFGGYNALVELSCLPPSR